VPGAGIAAAIAAALAAVLLAAPARGTSPPQVLVSYGFDDESNETGPDTFHVFENASGHVRLSREIARSGGFSVEIADSAGDGDFPELQGFFPERHTGRLVVRFSILVATPDEPWNAGLAGPGGFGVGENGLAFRLEARGGYFWHTSDSIPKRIAPIEPFVWYDFRLDYDLDAGTYDLRLSREGEREPFVRLVRQPNVVSAPGSTIDKFSFIGDLGDRGRATYFVDDVEIASTEAADLAAFVAPGRRRLFVDAYLAERDRAQRNPGCPPAAGVEDFAIAPQRLSELKASGALATLRAALESDPAAIAAVDPRLAELPEIAAVLAWDTGCAELGAGRPAAALPRLERAASLQPAAPLYPLALAHALARLDRLDEASDRLAEAHAALGEDARYAVAMSLVGARRADLGEAEVWVAAPAESRADLPADPLLRDLELGNFHDGLLAALRDRFPDAWRTKVDEALLFEQYFWVLVARADYVRAGDFARRLAERYRAAGVDPARWWDRAGDAALLARDLPRARDLYERELASPDPQARIAASLKLADVAALDGDRAAERHWREAIYGRLVAP
jgi:hypothetical protein